MRKTMRLFFLLASLCGALALVLVLPSGRAAAAMEVSFRAQYVVNDAVDYAMDVDDPLWPLDVAETIVITSATDSGPGSLRQALVDAISGDTITFDAAVFPPASPVTITLLSALPEISVGNLTIDGSNAGVVLDGQYLSAGDGLRITSDGNTIKGFQIISFPGDGVEITGGAKNNAIGGDWAVGAAPRGEGNVITLNGGDGVNINGAGTMSNTVSGNLIGLDLDGAVDRQPWPLAVSPNYAADRTLFAGTEAHGVFKSTDGGGSWVPANAGLTISNVLVLAVSPNYATDHTLFAGTVGGGIFRSIDKGGTWMRVDGDVTGQDMRALAISPDYASDGHVFASTWGGVFASTDGGDNWTPQGLSDYEVYALAVPPTYGADQTVFAGTDAGVFTTTNQGSSWSEASSGLGDVSVTALAISPGYAGDQTVFAGTGGNGVYKSTNEGAGWVEASTGLVGGDISHLTISPGYATDQTLFAVTDGDNIEKSIDGGSNWTGANSDLPTVYIGGITPSSNYATDQNVFLSTHWFGVFRSVDGGGHWTSTNNGLTELGNHGHGVSISDGAEWHIIGGETAGERNVISRNQWDGIGIGADHNTVIGNYVGTDMTGSMGLGNGSGVTISGAQNAVGGAKAGERNVVSGNREAGISIFGGSAMSNTILGNLIGTDVTGSAAVGNRGSGVVIGNEGGPGPQQNRIGGTTAGERNVISGNDWGGVNINGVGAMSNTVCGNYIGTDISGTAAISNTGNGVSIWYGAQYNVIGGDSENERNVISGNSGSGVHLTSADTMSNTISGNYIGTDASGMASIPNDDDGIHISVGASRNRIGEGNVIAYSAGNGIIMDPAAAYNTITRNSIHSSGGTGINLSGGGNMGVSAPILTDVTANTVSGVASMAYITIEVFSDDEDEGRIYEGTTTTDGGGSFTFSKPEGLSGPYLTATATDGDGNTSEFSAPMTGVCVGLSDVSISGPTNGYTDTLYTLSAVLVPPASTPPITYTWSPGPDSGQGTASAAYGWATPGLYTLTLEVENCGGMASDTHTVSITVPVPGPNLCITKSVKVPLAEVPLGEVVTYTIVLENSGDGIATGVMMTDRLPSGVRFGEWLVQGSALLPPPGDTVVWGLWDVPAESAYRIGFTAVVTTNEAYVGDVVNNLVEYTAGSGGSGFDGATFRIEGVPANQAPYVPSSPEPDDGAVGVPITQTLRWTGGDPDGDPVTYTVALGIADPPASVATVTGSSYTPALVGDTTYYWRIDATDGISVSSGPVWWFSTVAASHAGGDAYEPDDTCEQASDIGTDGAIQRHTFHAEADQDWIRFEGTAGLTYTLEARVPPTSTADVVLEVYGSCPGGWQGGQDPSFSPDIFLQFVAPADGDYYIRMTNQDPGTYGADNAYDLSVRAPAVNTLPGALVLVAGRYGTNDPLQPNIYHVTDAVYRLFRQHGYTEDRIYYLAPTLLLDPDQDGAFDDVDYTATNANLEAAIAEAADDVGTDRAFTIYLMDHGSHDKFYLDRPFGHWFTPAELDGWLDQLEADVPGVKINVILDACYSGSFIEPAVEVSQENRVVIASTAAYAVAYASGSGAVFSDAFIDGLDQGMSLQGAFNEAKWAAELAHPDQTPWLDDNGDAKPNTAGDGQEAGQRGFAFAGTFAAAMWAPYIVEAEIRNLDLEHAEGEIWAQVVDDERVHHAWAVLYPPSYRPAESSEELVEEPVAYQLLDRGSDWRAITYNKFDEVGEYRIVFYAEDDGGLLARPKLVTVRTGWLVYLPAVLREG